ncbi:MAG: shikimate dehydrogenase [Lachnospiraceae bacterium]|nr:shikimate dehydrogenase [Lachnospiraceae bacterium]
MDTYQITGHTRMGGLLGSPVSHSLSPMMHNDSFRALSIDYVYLCFDIGTQQLPAVVQAFRDMNVFGFNLTMPHKRAVIPLLDELTDAAKLCGAVNTVRCDHGRLTGHSTDGTGFLTSLARAGYSISGKTVTVLGAGGAAMAILAQMVLDGAEKIYVACRRSSSWQANEEKISRLSEAGRTILELVDTGDAERLKSCIAESTLLVNGTPVGMAPDTDVSPIPQGQSMFHRDLLCADVIYNPRKTRFLAEAEAAGCRTLGGLGMLLYQGAAAFSFWTGQEMPVDMIRERYFPGVL